MNKDFKMPLPVIDEREMETLGDLALRFHKLTQPGAVQKLGKKVANYVPEDIKNLVAGAGIALSEQQIYKEMLEVAGQGFKKIEEQAAKYSISEKTIIETINKHSTVKITSLEQICTLRCYEVAKAVNQSSNWDLLYAGLEGGITGSAGLAGLPFNLVLGTFLFYRAVQTIAMFYGYDVQRDASEMVIAAEVLSNAMNPSETFVGGTTTMVGKIMIMTQAGLVKKMSSKSWTEMAKRQGIPLLLTQMRALANKSAKKALEQAGKKGLEGSIFRDTLEQIGSKLTKKAIHKATPGFSAFLGALIDTAQMKQVIEYADVFYQKRFLHEKEQRIRCLAGEGIEILDAEVIEVSDTE